MGGCLKNLKAKQFSEVFCAFPAASKEDVEFVTSLQLQEVKSADKDVATFRANLMAMNPDPQKKLKDAPIPMKPREVVVEAAEEAAEEEAEEPVAAQGVLELRYCHMPTRNIFY